MRWEYPCPVLWEFIQNLLGPLSFLQGRECSSQQRIRWGGIAQLWLWSGWTEEPKWEWEVEHWE